MASLRPNLVKRIDRLPKPTSVAAAMQPLFEAISNSIHSVQARFGEMAADEGRVVVTVSTNRKKEDVWATVEDNGVGLDAPNWDAFTTTDTDNKLSIGGKGVGRLLWLDCFERVHVDTVFAGDEGLARRTFNFVLANDEQINNYREELAKSAATTSFLVRFDGLRDNVIKRNFLDAIASSFNTSRRIFFRPSLAAGVPPSQCMLGTRFTFIRRMSTTSSTARKPGSGWTPKLMALSI